MVGLLQYLPACLPPRRPTTPALGPVPAPPGQLEIEPPVNPHCNPGVLERLLVERPAEVQRIVPRLRKHLGHPSPEQLSQQLRARGASPALLQAASSYVCPSCAQLAPPHQAPKSSLRSATALNQRLMANTLWITLPGGRTVPVLSMLDAATKYVVARPLQSESLGQFLRAIERGWVKLFGPPYVLQVDARGQTLDDLRQALDFFVPQVNCSTTVQGYSPTEWVFGYRPELPGLLLGDNVNAVILKPLLTSAASLNCRQWPRRP